MVPEKLDTAHRLLAEGKRGAGLSAGEWPNKKGGRNRPEKDMRTDHAQSAKDNADPARWF